MNSKVRNAVKKVFASVTAVAVMSANAAAVYAEQVRDESSGKIVYENNPDYVIEKISHPEKGAGETDGMVDYIGGGEIRVDSEGSEGCRGEIYSWAAVGYGDYIYVSTFYNALKQTITILAMQYGYDFSDQEKFKATIDALYNGTFFLEEEDGGNPGGVLVKINVKTGETKMIMSQGDEDIEGVALRNAVEYNGKLYFCGGMQLKGEKGSIPRICQVDPETDEFKVVYSGMTLGEVGLAMANNIMAGIRGITVHNGKLVVSCVGIDGAFVVESDHPQDGQEAFRRIADMDALMDYPAYTMTDSILGGSIWDIASFNGKLYMVICTGRQKNPDGTDNEYFKETGHLQNFAIVVGEEDSDGNYTWRALAGDQVKDGARYPFGLDSSRTSCGAANLVVYKDHLYIGEYNDEEIAIKDIYFKKDFSFMNENLEQSVKLYRMDVNENIELVVGDPTEEFPVSLSGIGTGFGKHDTQYIWKMCEYNDKLYVGTFDVSSLLYPVGQFANGDILKNSAEQWESQINYIMRLIEILRKDAEESPEELKTYAGIDENVQIPISEIVKLEYDLSDYTEYINRLNDIITELREAIEQGDAEKIAELYEELTEVYEELTERIEADLEAASGNMEAIYAQILEMIRQIYDKTLGSEEAKMVSSALKCMSYLTNSERGFDLYVSDDGISFTAVTTDGFGDPYNHGLRVTAITDSGLAIGTANPFYGTQIWLLNEKYPHIHNLVKHDKTEPTCTERGVMEHYECTECGTIFLDEKGTIKLINKEDIIIPELGHDPKIFYFKAPTVDAEGYTGDCICERCGELLDKGRVTPRLPSDAPDVPDVPDVPDEPDPPAVHVHTPVKHEAVAPTCTESGMAEYYECTDCGKLYKEKECINEITDLSSLIIPALGHDTELRGYKEATVNDEGYTGDTVCKRCGAVIEYGKTIPKIVLETPQLPANFVPGGITGEIIKECSVKGKRLVGWDDVLKAIPDYADNSFTVDLNEDTKVPAAIFKALSDNNVTMNAVVNEKYTYIIKGSVIPAVSGAVDLSLGDGKSDSINIRTLSKNNFSLSVNLGPQNAGKYANLITEDGKCADSVKISNIGRARFNAANTGKYTIEIGEMKPVLSVSSKTSDSVTLEWRGKSNADGYIVEVLKNGKWTKTAKIKNPDTTTYTVKKLKSATEYKFRLRSYKAKDGKLYLSKYGEEITAETD